MALAEDSTATASAEEEPSIGQQVLGRVPALKNHNLRRVRLLPVRPGPLAFMLTHLIN